MYYFDKKIFMQNVNVCKNNASNSYCVTFDKYKPIWRNKEWGLTYKNGRTLLSVYHLRDTSVSKTIMYEIT